MKLICSRCGEQAMVMFKAVTTGKEKWQVCPDCLAEIVLMRIILEPPELKLLKKGIN